MCNGPPNDVGPAERLKRLQKSQTFWMNSVWSQPDHFPYSESTTMMPYPAAVSGNLMIFRSGNFADSVMLLLLRFPSELRDIQEQQWHLCLEFERVEYISADDSQDLLIFSSSVLNSKRSYSHAQWAMSSLVYQISTFGHSLQGESIL